YRPDLRHAEALNKESPYRQFYIWRDGTPDVCPNNWQSKFGGSAWLTVRFKPPSAAAPGAGIARANNIIYTFSRLNRPT
ncbi:Trehalose-6-phosphate hydrolase, partial [Salmonella enterica subsp. enterica serovar Hvittingfoss str. A4-620]